MVWTEDGPVARQVVEVVHDHSHEQVDYLRTSHSDTGDRPHRRYYLVNNAEDIDSASNCDHAHA